MNIPLPRLCPPTIAAVLLWAVALSPQSLLAQPPRPDQAGTGGAGKDVTIRATRITQPIQLDGRLDDGAYEAVEAITGFIQQEPREGELTTERTDVWVLFDEKNIYITAKCWDSQPNRQVATELRRDNGNIFQNESFTVVLDTFHDRRNGFMFQTNVLGALRDQAIVDDTNNQSWNTVWEVRTGRYDWGWVAEMMIPFKSLRYQGSGPQEWGINFRRVIKWKNEFAYLTAIPASFGTQSAVSRMGSAATLLGLETPGQSKNLELKPYVVSSVTTDKTASAPFDDKADASGGFDFKYGLTRGLILDTTVNTDFAQVEEDQQQVNLTRFSLFFPEKRDFFLEGSGVFAFGGVAANTGGNPGDVPVMFFSRRVGLSQGQSVPVVAGARVAGRSGKYQIGGVNIQTDDKPSAGAVATNFTAVRIKRDILRRSNFGIIATRRSPATAGRDTNLAFGADVNLFLFTNLTSGGYYARTESAGLSTGQDSYRGRIEFAGDRYGWTAEHLAIGKNFVPEVGYVRRTDFRRSFGEARFSPRPKGSKLVRKYSLTGSYDYVTDAAMAEVQDTELRGVFNIDYQTGDTWNAEYSRKHELVPAAFTINPGTRVPAGAYDDHSVRTQYSLGTQRRVSGRFFLARGTLYRGTTTEAGYSGGRIAIVPQFVIEPSLSLNWVRLPYGDFSAPVIGSRVIFMPNPQTALTSFVQYNGSTHTVNTSIRLRWEYRGGSEIFVVYSDGRDTRAPGYPDLLNRSLAFKMTRLLRF